MGWVSIITRVDKFYIHPLVPEEFESFKHVTRKIRKCAFLGYVSASLIVQFLYVVCFHAVERA